LRYSLRRRFWWIGAWSSITACSSHPCGAGPPKECSRQERHSSALQAAASSVIWERDETTFVASALVPSTPALGECRVVGPSWQEGGVASRPARVELACNDDASSESRLYHLEVELPGDSRAWTGEFDALSCREWQLGCSVQYTNPACARVLVEEATGSEAPFPSLVTPDFRRTYRVTFDTLDRTRGDREGECSRAVSASLQFVETAASFSTSGGNCDVGCL